MTKLPGLSAKTPWYEQDSDLTDEEKVEILQILKEAVGHSLADKIQIEEAIRVIAGRIAEKEIFGGKK